MCLSGVPTREAEPVGHIGSKELVQAMCKSHNFGAGYQKGQARTLGHEQKLPGTGDISFLESQICFFGLSTDGNWPSRVIPGEAHGSPLQYSCLENPWAQKRLAGYSPWGDRVRYD